MNAPRRSYPCAADFRLSGCAAKPQPVHLEYREGMSGSHKLSRPLTLLVLLAVMVAQLAAFAPGHSDDHASHCCPICHASHAPLLRAKPLLEFVPPAVRTYWRIAPVALPSMVDVFTSGASTRGPPVLS